MKKGILLLVGFTLSVVLMAQSPLAKSILEKVKKHQVIDSLKVKNEHHPLPKSSHPTFRSACVVDKQKLDSVIRPEIEKIYFIYDANGNNIQWIDYKWDSGTNTWMAFIKVDYICDGSGNKTQEIEARWHSDTNTWVPVYRTDYTYDGIGKETQKINSQWDMVANIWVVHSKNDYTYDSNGNNTQDLCYSCDSGGSVLKPYSKTDYTFDSNGNNTQVLDSLWDTINGIWVGNTKSDYTFDGNGNCTQYIYSTWDTTNSIWVLMTKYDYVFDSNGKKTQEISYKWDLPGNSLEVYSKDDYTFDGNGNCIQKNSYEWDGTIWEEASKDDYLFDSYGNNIQDTFSFWDRFNSLWLIMSKSDKVYNNAYSYSDLLLPIDEPANEVNSADFFHHELLSTASFDWDISTGTWTPDGNAVQYYYTNFTAADIKANTASTLIVSAQNNQVLVKGIAKGETLTIYNLQGTALYNQKADTDTVVVSLPAHGVYVVKVGTRTVKVVD